LLHDVTRVVNQRRAANPTADDPFLGLYISDDEADRLLQESREVPPLHPDVAARRAELDRVAAAADDTGDEIRILRLARSCALSTTDVDLLIVACAPDLDARFERLYGYLNDDVSRRRASIGLALELCRLRPTDGLARERFDARSPLVRNGLLAVEDDDRPFLTRSLRVPDRVTAHLLGDERPDASLAGVLVAEPVRDTRPQPVLVAALAAGVSLCYVRERLGASGISAAARALTDLGRRAVVLDLRRVPVSGLSDLSLVAARESLLTGGAVVAGPVEAVGEQEAYAVHTLAALPCQVVLAGRRGWDPEWSARLPLVIELHAASLDDRSAQWQEALRGAAVGRVAVGELDPAAATVNFRLGPHQIASAAASAALHATYDGGLINAGGVRAAARAQNAAGLERLARRVEPAVGWDDLVLPPAPTTALRELAARARRRDLVLDTWGMRPGGGRGRGITAMFAGDSGTGKTMSAEVLAGDLGLDLYVVNLATVVDKYVGETEKNLERIFGEADGINGVLLFDEADALFGKRSEVRDAHDRYANIEVAYLLQRMETFDGLALLSTNLRANVDEAFARRLDAIVDFPLPEPEYREIIWDHCLGRLAPRGGDLDLGFCARSFELSGGNIRSITLSAAYLAAERGGAISMEDLIRATVGEYRKLGRLCVEAEFGPYYALAAPEAR
jgi:hypothetical protein